MNETNQKPEKKDFFKNLGCTIISFLWSGVLAFCLASTLKTAYEELHPGVFLLIGISAWIILRVIRFLMAKNAKLFAGEYLDATNMQLIFIFVIDGIISCFTVGKRLAEGGDIANPVLLIVLGIVWLILFSFGAISAIKGNYKKAQQAISLLEQIGSSLTNEDVTSLEVTTWIDGETKKVLKWVQLKDDPEEEEEESGNSEN